MSESEWFTPRVINPGLPTETHWDPEKWEDRTPLPKPIPVATVKRALAAHEVERLWGSNGREQWLEAVRRAEFALGGL